MNWLVIHQEIESFYKRVLEREPGSVPGRGLVPGNVIRSVENPAKVYAHLAELLSPQDFLACCSVSVPELERAWSRNKGLTASQAKESFKKFLGNLLVEKRNAPSLKPL